MVTTVTLRALTTIYTHFHQADGPRNTWRLIAWTICPKCGRPMAAPDPVDIHRTREDLEAAGFVYLEREPDFATWNEERQGFICFYYCLHKIPPKE